MGRQIQILVFNVSFILYITESEKLAQVIPPSYILIKGRRQDSSDLFNNKIKGEIMRFRQSYPVFMNYNWIVMLVGEPRISSCFMI